MCVAFAIMMMAMIISWFGAWTWSNCWNAEPDVNLVGYAAAQGLALLESRDPHSFYYLGIDCRSIAVQRPSRFARLPLLP